MTDLKQLIEQYAETEDVKSLDAIYPKIMLVGTDHERGILADGYFNMFLQCQYDNMCSKYNGEDNILELFIWLKKIRRLSPQFDEYNACMAYAYEMLEHEVEEIVRKEEYVTLAIEYFNLHIQEDGDSDTIYVSIAEAWLRRCRYEGNFSSSIFFQEIQPMLIKAIEHERKPENKYEFHQFNGTSMGAYLEMSYKILALPFANAYRVHCSFMSTFQELVTEYAKTDRAVYYYWVNKLIEITDWQNYQHLDDHKITEQTVAQIWEEAREILSVIENEQTTDSYLLSDYGQLFSKMGYLDNSLHYHEIALNYYMSGLTLQSGRWIFSSCIANQLREIAFLFMEQGNMEEAEKRYSQAIDIMRKAVLQESSMHHCLKLGDLQFEYSKLFENFKNHNRLIWALNQYKLAEIDGSKHYTSPFYGQVKCYFYLHDFNNCVNALQRCKDYFSYQDQTHNFKELKEDADFKEILPLLEHLK